MGKIAFVFAGQGAQFLGMGRELYDNCPPAKEVFDRLEALRPDTLRQCFEGTPEELRETKNTQPCMFAVELAAAEALRAAGIKADMTAGFSLGEIAAVTWSGMADLETGFSLVCRRGELMQQAALQRAAAMAAVLKLDNEAVKKLCAGFKEVWPVNYNCPGQISVSGAAEEMPAFIQAVKAAGGRAVPINVQGGFHSPFMAEAAEAFGEALAAVTFASPAIPLYADRTGEPYGSDPRALLSQQISSPVLWEKLIRNMTAAGADTFIELGPGRTLCGLIGKIDKGLRTFAVSETKDIQAVITEVQTC